MCLFSDIARGNKGRLAGREGSGNAPARLLHSSPRLTTRTAILINLKDRAGKRVTISRRYRKTTHDGVTDNEKLAYKKYHFPNRFQNHSLWLRSTVGPAGFNHDRSEQIGLWSRCRKQG
jgi:hypothetical protein